MSSSHAAEDADGPRAQRLPALPPHFVGRDELARNLEAKLQQCRLVTLVGAGGLGKTTLAIAVARRMAPAQADGVCFVDLASLSDGDSPAARLAAALGIEVAPQRAAEQVRACLRQRRMLVVLDSCETTIDAAARIAEDLLAAAPALRLLATSREPLQADGEWVHRVAPLGWPPEDRAFPAWLAMTYPAVQLFFRIAHERRATLAPTQRNADTVTRLCRQLEGSPLAIALAASHIGRLGLEGLAEQVGGRMLTLAADPDAKGEPDTESRHRTLEAVLRWSYRLLQPPEQQVLCSLALFRGGFDLTAALAVAQEPQRAVDASAAVLDLVEKSLLSTLHADQTVLFRMADTTRVFAEGQLVAAGTAAHRAARQRHSRYLVHLLGLAEQRWSAMDRIDWRRQHGVWIDDVRHALAWAFAPDGDRLVAVELTVLSFGLADHTALFPEHRGFVDRALAEVVLLEPPRPDLERRLNSLPAIGQLRSLSEDPRQLATLVEAVEVARAAGSAAEQLGMLLTVFAHRFQLGDYPGALDWSFRMQRLAEAHADRFADLTARRTRAQALHFLGEHGASRTLAREICAQPAADIPLAYMPSPVGTGVSTRILLSRILWIEGFADQALRMVDECLRLAERDAPQSRCQALAVAALPIGLWCGRIAACEAWLDELDELACRHDYQYWQTWSQLYAALLGRAEGAALEAAALSLTQPRHTKFRDHLVTFDGTLAQEVSARVEAGTVGWCAPEVLRVQAEGEIERGSLDTAAMYVARAIDLARSQGALAWELRAAMTAMRLSTLTGAAVRGREVLAAVYGRFGEGFSTSDLRAANRMLTGHARGA